MLAHAWTAYERPARNPLAGPIRTVSYAYDAASNRIAFTNPEAGITSYTYDSLNRLTALRDFGANAFTFSYDALGRRTGLNRPNLVNTSYTYDALSRLLSVVHQQGPIGAGTRYSYDAAGNRTSRTDFAVGAGQVVQSYTYDSIYQLTQAVVSTVPPTTTESYTYDKMGNRLSSLGLSPYAYNSSNQLTSKPGTTYTYDANGNALSKTDLSGTTSYSWDFENRLVSVALPGTAGTVAFKYDPFGRRVQKGSATGTTVFAYDGDNMIEELSATGLVTTQYSQGLDIDEPLAMYRAGAVNFYHADGLGSISALTDATGIPAAAYVYDSFGNTFPAPGSVTNPFRYTAREFDSETGLYYYRARYYDASIGRFISEDRLGIRDNLNMYVYVHNNPTTFGDPLGLYTLKRFPADLEVQMRNAINDALAKLRNLCPSCAGADAPKVANAIENATFIYKPKQKDCGFVGPLSFTGVRHEVGIGPSAFTPECCSLASTVAHEAVHLTRGRDNKAYDLEEKCFGCKRPQKD